MKVEFNNLTKVSFAELKNVVGTDNLRPVMKGVYIDFKNQKLVCTDAHILIMYPIEITANNSGLDGIIVPVRFFNHLKYMQDIPRRKVIDFNYILTEEFAEVYWLGELVYRCRYIEGKYPNYEAVINDTPDKEVELNEIGIDLKMLARVADAIPSSLKKFKFKFFGKNRHIIFQELSYDYPTPIKGLIMPYNL